MTMNAAATAVADELIDDAGRFRVAVHEVAGSRVIDCGVAAGGGLGAGLRLARLCLANLAEVTLTPGPEVQVVSDDPVRACLASQYAGWQVKVDDYFAMASGPMRALLGTEAVFDDVPGREASDAAAGSLEATKLPPAGVVEYVAGKLGLDPARLTLAVAPAASAAGAIQVVARSLETALHKLHALKFDVTEVVSGVGTAPLPPVAADELQAIGRTNDAILYGGRVTLWVRSDDDTLAELGPKVPSAGSGDHGAPFAELFARYGDFYKIDPMLFSPAEVTFINLATGRAHRFGRTEPDVLRRSFGV